MFDKIKRLGTETAVYGISTILGRFLTFILTPIYTYFLTPSDLGIVATVFAYIAFFNVIYSFGMEGAFMKYVSTLEIGNRKQNFTIPLVAVTLTSTLLSVAIGAFSAPLARLTGVPAVHGSVISMAGWILLLDAISVIPFASLRMERQARTFVTIRVVGITVNVLLNILFLTKLHMGVEGIFLAGIVSSAFVLVLLLPHVLKNLSFEWTESLLPALLRFGLPSVPAGLASMMIQVVDRPILKSLSGDAAAGIYQANYRLGIFMMLIVSMFDFAWRPFFLTHAPDPDARKLFARVLTYFCLIATAVFLVLTLFLRDIVTLPLFWGYSLLARPYWAGLWVVPPVLLGYLFLGVYNNFMAGVYIEKRTNVLPGLTFTGAAVNVAANYLLIPRFGMVGAAAATFLAYFIMAVVAYFVVHRFYPVPYEWGRVVKIVFSAALVVVLWLLVRAGAFEMLWKIFLVLLFVGLMFLMKFFDRAELRILSDLFSRKVPPSSQADVPPSDDL
jgi:O-antigen/teichoic acid export membrane protein